MSKKLLSELEDGMSQTERVIPSLSPDYIKIDDRDIPELLKFLSELSAQFNYYNSNNQIEGNWEDFFKSDFNTLITLISKVDIKKYSKKYERLKLMIRYAKNENEMAVYFKDLFETVWEAAQLIIEFLKKINNVNAKNTMVKDSSIILTNCMVEVNKLKNYNLQAQQLLGNNVRINFGHVGDITEEDQAGLEEINIFGEYVDINEKILNATTFIDEIFSGLKSKLNRLLSIAEYYLKNNNLLEQQYDPYLGLLIAFLHLYTHLQEQLNGFTKKHLDFYYKDVLGIEPKPLHPDSVHLLFETNVSNHTIRLNAGEKLMAKVKEIEKPLIYKLQDDLIVSKAGIAELKTIFISDNALFSDNNENTNLHIEQVFAGNYPVITPAAFLKESMLVRSWPILGEDQNEFPQDERTMEDTEIGIIVGSPLLYLPQGERLVQLTFKFEEKTFEDFNNFIRDFAKRSKKSEEAVLIEMLSNAFTADYTAIDGWQPVKNLRVKTPGENCIEISFRLSYQDKSIDIYKPAIHGLHYNNSLPLIRLLLNNNASHNPFTLFRNLLLDQVTIKTKVKGFQNVALQNNIGSLSATNPFQIFGPQPSVGAFLNIENSNVFNRFTRDFTIRLEWLDLPKEPGGFSTYYSGYDTAVNNDSFLIRMSALSDGKFIPKPENQQKFKLFETEEIEEGLEQLEETTEIGEIDMKKLEFSNNMQLAEEENQDIMFKGGAVRITLNAPPEAFGHQIFPQIFPEIALHNSKRFTKTLPIPNQPFIPNVKSISIDYTLEQTEVLKGDSMDSDSANKMVLIHQYPFGFDEIYPKNNRRTYPFMPQFEYPNNLYIGLKDIKPGHELSLLFKLEEKNFHHTLHSSSPVTWSYLYQKTWIPLKSKDILHDTTNNFINTGIIRIKIPYAINKDNTILNPDLFWLRASTQVKTDIKSRVIAIYPHAATAIQALEPGNEKTIDFNLPSNSIKGFVRKMPEIQNIWQPFPSFGGKMAEQEDQYRTRVSERLRHKQRPVTMRDIEQFILDEFSQILMVKCLGQSDEDQLVLPGINIQVILIPKEQDSGGFTSDQPKVNLATLFKVKQFLTPFLSPFIKVEVGNPVYERVKVVCKVQFNKAMNFDEGFYIRELNKDIKKYICSWLYESTASLTIGASIYLSDMLNYIKGLPYIFNVTGFSLVHFFKARDIQTGEYNSKIIDSAITSVEFIRGSVPEAVLIPANDHLITVQKDIIYEEPSKVGIGSLPVGDELLISGYNEDRNNLNPETGETEPDENFRLIINHHIE